MWPQKNKNKKQLFLCKYWNKCNLLRRAADLFGQLHTFPLLETRFVHICALHTSINSHRNQIKRWWMLDTLWTHMDRWIALVWFCCCCPIYQLRKTWPFILMNSHVHKNESKMELECSLLRFASHRECATGRRPCVKWGSRAATLTHQLRILRSGFCRTPSPMDRNGSQCV